MFVYLSVRRPSTGLKASVWKFYKCWIDFDEISYWGVKGKVKLSLCLTN
jgi:hypothetical protein